ncbi:HNH endonuclease [Rhodococcus hoagii]|nr:HNH endonuclease [Prescottella equi]
MAWQRGGPSRTSTPSHRAFRRTVLNRDNHTCQHCGHHDPTGTTVQADHIVNHAQGGTDHPDNGQTLCLPCHKTKTGQEAAAARTGRNRRTPEPHPGLTR